MLRNYLKVAIRSIRKNKLYAGLNILGLSVGLASFFIIYLFIQNELAYDQFHEKKDRVYRIVKITERGDATEKSSIIETALAPLVAQLIPETENYSRLNMRTIFLPNRNGDSGTWDEAKGLGIDEGFFEFFNLDLISGSKLSSSNAQSGFLMSESKALQYYGTTDVLGENIKLGKDNLVLIGVFKDFKQTSSIKAEVVFLTKKSKLYPPKTGSFTSFNVQSFFLLRQNTDVEVFNKKLNELHLENTRYENSTVALQPFSEVHFSLDVNGPVPEKTDAQYILIFSLIAFFILACAVFNYISLALSQSLERAKEIGVRKVIGAKRTSLYSQFIIESVIQVLISFVVAIVLVELLIPQLETLVERDLGISVFQAPEIIAKGLLFSLFIALVSAVYPAYLSTRMNVVNIFKQKSGSGSSNRMIAFVAVFQIIVFIALTCAAVTSNKQMHFMRNEKLGFDQDLQYVINDLSYRSENAFKNDVLGLTGVKAASLARVVPTKWAGSTGFKGVKGRFQTFDIDEDYLETMGMTLLEGRNFKPEDIIDSATVIMVNATAAKEIAPNGSAVGKVLPFGRDGGMYSKGGDKRIIGVVSDFHYVSKKEIIEPALFHPIQYPGLLVVKLSDLNLSGTIEALRDAFKKHNGGREINAYFLNDKVEAQYKQENVMITMINTFMAVAAIVAFIGLFGIAGYSVKRRTKEVGIRKVLGAGFMAIQSTLNRASLAKLALAIAISIPLVVYWMDSWLSDFAYRIDIPYGLISLSVIAAAIILLLVASFHSVRVFLINPVDILKDE